jgi:hypothetical protein
MHTVLIHVAAFRMSEDLMSDDKCSRAISTDTRYDIGTEKNDYFEVNYTQDQLTAKRTLVCEKVMEGSGQARSI